MEAEQLEYTNGVVSAHLSSPPLGGIDSDDVLDWGILWSAIFAHYRLYVVSRLAGLVPVYQEIFTGMWAENGGSDLPVVDEAKSQTQATKNWSQRGAMIQ